VVIKVLALQCTNSTFIWAWNRIAPALWPVIVDYILKGGLVLVTMTAGKWFHLAGVNMSLDSVALELLTTLINTRDICILTAKPQVSFRRVFIQMFIYLPQFSFPITAIFSVYAVYIKLVERTL